MANFQHDMTVAGWTRDQLLANLREAGEDCETRREHFLSNSPNGHDYTTWKRHALAVAEAIRLLGS